MADRTALDTFSGDPCLGASILTRGCTPPRTLTHVDEFSTEPVDQKTVLVASGTVLALPLVAEAAGVALAVGAAAEPAQEALEAAVECRQQQAVRLP